MEKKIDYPSERINVNKIESRIKTRYYLKLLTVKMLKLFASSKSKTAKYKTDENVPYLEINEALLVQCIILNKHYQQDSRVLYTFVHNKSFGQLLGISPKNFIISELYIEVWFTDQNSKPLDIEDKINISLVIN